MVPGLCSPSATPRALSAARRDSDSERRLQRSTSSRAAALLCAGDSVLSSVGVQRTPSACRDTNGRSASATLSATARRRAVLGCTGLAECRADMEDLARPVSRASSSVFVFASPDQVRLPTVEPLPVQRTTLRDTTPKLVQRLGGTQANASTICGHVAALMGDFLVRCKVGKGLVDGASAPNPLVLQYSKLCLADRLRRAFEHDFVVRARLDMFLWQAVAMPKKPGARPAA